MSYNQSLLNAYYDKQDKNECVYSIFEHDLTRELYLLPPHERQSIKVLNDFIQSLKSEAWVNQFEMSGEIWDFSDDVLEATENAIVTCNEWDKENQQPKGGYYG
jgi:hypothetical protein